MLSESPGSAVRGHRALRPFLIVDSHEAIRRSLSELINRRVEWYVAGEAACAVDGLRWVHERRPHVAIVDLRLGQIDGIELTLNIAAIAPNVRIVGYSYRDDRRSVARFLEAGGHGFVSKYEPIEALVETIEQALEGRLRVSYRDASASEASFESRPSA